jgi:hypothetical protein
MSLPEFMEFVIVYSTELKDIPDWILCQPNH